MGRCIFRNSWWLWVVRSVDTKRQAEPFLFDSVLKYMEWTWDSCFPRVIEMIVWMMKPISIRLVFPIYPGECFSADTNEWSKLDGNMVYCFQSKHHLHKKVDCPICSLSCANRQASDTIFFTASEWSCEKNIMESPTMKFSNDESQLQQTEELISLHEVFRRFSDICYFDVLKLKRETMRTIFRRQVWYITLPIRTGIT